MSCQSRESIVTILDTINRTKRPRILLRTARLGVPDYRRETDLRRILRLPAAPPPGLGVLRQLIDLEAAYERLRTHPTEAIGQAWRAARHIEVMIALMAETRLIAQAIPVESRNRQGACRSAPSVGVHTRYAACTATSGKARHDDGCFGDLHPLGQARPLRTRYPGADRRAPAGG